MCGYEIPMGNFSMPQQPFETGSPTVGASASVGYNDASAARGKGTLNDSLEGCAMAGGRSDRGARASASAGQRPPSCLLQVRPWSQALRQMQVGVAMEERPGASSSAEKRPRRHGPSRSRSLQP
ncbi:hypothetical protein VPH35_066129 [Triticum aestivum]